MQNERIKKLFIFTDPQKWFKINKTRLVTLSTPLPLQKETKTNLDEKNVDLSTASDEIISESNTTPTVNITDTEVKVDIDEKDTNTEATKIVQDSDRNENEEDIDSLETPSLAKDDKNDVSIESANGLC